MYLLTKPTRRFRIVFSKAAVGGRSDRGAGGGACDAADRSHRRDRRLGHRRGHGGLRRRRSRWRYGLCARLSRSEQLHVAGACHRPRLRAHHGRCILAGLLPGTQTFSIRQATTLGLADALQDGGRGSTTIDPSTSAVVLGIVIGGVHWCWPAGGSPDTSCAAVTEPFLAGIGRVVANSAPP